MTPNVHDLLRGRKGFIHVIIIGLYVPLSSLAMDRLQYVFLHEYYLL